MSTASVRAGILVWTCTAVSLACSAAPLCEGSRTCGADSAGDAGEAGRGGQSGDGQMPSGVDAAGNAAGESSVSEGGAAGAVDPAGCETDADCDDQDSCTGVEACVGGVCEAGVPVECPAGMACSAEADSACVFGSAPWIVYVADDETQGLFEAFAVKSDLLGQLDPLKISPQLDAGWAVKGIGPWSPDGSTVVLQTRDAVGDDYRAYAVRFDEKRLPESALPLTGGLPASATQTVTWSPSGQSLLVTRSDGVYAVRYAPGSPVTRALLSAAGFGAVSGLFRSDDEAVWMGHSGAAPYGWSVARALDHGHGWNQDTLVSDQPIIWGWLVPGAEVAVYLTQTQPGERSLFLLDTVTGAQPIQLAGPAVSTVLGASPDFSYLAVATSTTSSRDSSLYVGPASNAASLSLLRAHIKLNPDQIMSSSSPFAPDGSVAALFQESSAPSTPPLKQLVAFDPKGGTQQWTPIPARQGVLGGQLLWSPDSSLMALPTRTGASSDDTLTFVSVPGYAVHELAMFPQYQLRWLYSAFSSGSEFFFFVYGPPDAGRGGYVDLRQGIDGAVVHDGIGQAFRGWSLPSHGTEALFLEGPDPDRDCFYLDLSGETAAAPVQVSGSGTTTACAFQQLP